MVSGQGPLLNQGHLRSRTVFSNNSRQNHGRDNGGINVSGRSGPFSDLTSGGRILNFTGRYAIGFNTARSAAMYSFANRLN